MAEQVLVTAAVELHGFPELLAGRRFGSLTGR